MDFFLSDNNLLLILVAVTSGVMLALPRLMRGGVRTTTVQGAVQLANQQDGVFVDVRHDGAFKAGAIPNARHVALADIPAKVNSLPKNRPVIVYCETGRTSQRAAATLRKQGLEQVYSLDGGLRAWLQAGMPLSKKS